MLVQAAAAAAGGQQYPAPALYVVATPIGNLSDLSFRALHVLATVDAIACEDTRHSTRLLEHFGFKPPLARAHEHNERDAPPGRPRPARLAAKGRLHRDAGTPAVSDPGAALVAAARDAGYRVVPIPGASSSLAALSVAGDTLESGFAVVGFLPARGAERARALGQCATARPTQVLFEAPHRIESLAAALGEACPERRVTLCRELTKQFETVATLTAGGLATWLAGDANRARGEFVVVLHALADDSATGGDAAHDAPLLPLLKSLPLRAGGGAGCRDRRRAAQCPLRSRPRAQGRGTA
jgi:16S rRNA (cytidine1402-2'-O)-methyltransferase